MATTLASPTPFSELFAWLKTHVPPNQAFSLFVYVAHYPTHKVQDILNFCVKVQGVKIAGLDDREFEAPTLLGLYRLLEGAFCQEVPSDDVSADMAIVDAQ